MAEDQDLKETDDNQFDPSKLLEIQFEEKEDSSCDEDNTEENENDSGSVNLREKKVKLEDGLFHCDKCPKAFKNKHFYLSHIKMAHSLSPEVPAVPFKCGLCMKTITTPLGVIKHIEKHLEEPEKSCPGCGKQFYVMARLRHHLKACLQTLSELCTYCGARFNYSSSLRRHVMTVHCKDKDYMCKECGKKFKLLRYLKRHEIIHTSLKPFRCKYCDREFNRSANLDVHVRLHTGVKPYSCDICGLSFTHNVSCKKHKLKHFADTV